MIERIDLAELKQRIARISAAPGPHTSSLGTSGRMLVTGMPAVDGYLQDAAIPLAAVHEIAGHGGDEEQGAAGAEFLARTLMASASTGWVAWVTQDADLYAPGLAALGLDLRRLVLVTARRDADVCWALEEALRSQALSAVVGEIGHLTLTATRRFQLAAEQAGLPCFLLRRWRTRELANQQRAQPIAAVTRWRIAPDVAATTRDPALPLELGLVRRRLDLWRCRNAEAASWIMEFDHADVERIAAFPLPLAAALADRPAPAAEQPAKRQAAANLLRFG